MKFRHELKYLINEGDASLLKERLQSVLKPDVHAVQGVYSIRSLYFDDYWNSAYFDKIGGFSSRKKYRIRLYDLSDRVLKLECKMKQGAYIGKQSVRLSREEGDSILEGNYSFLLQRPETLCHQFYYECTTHVLRPKVYVDYEREPYTMDAGTVRVTFDRQVRGAYPSGNLTSENMVYHHVLEPGKLVLEVKFTEFLPDIVRDVLPMRAAELQSVSKYTLCCDQIHYLFGLPSE